ncbi:DUF5753 domain-containing protein [Sphaerisporangium melleum]|uniref:DUF5753 domain-containing protein n=1 Tax=Sphaerisporangium melleum TaxID=321316 RepID=UPI001663CDD9|nr:DUF5753 domain-containing protein [Sphaerisporangium melleum]
MIQGTLPTADREEIEGRLEARIRRQALLAKADPPHLWAIMNEGALRRGVGGRKVMHAQLQALLDATESPNISPQVVPFQGGAHPGMHDSFIVMQFDQGNADAIYLESMTNDLFLESETDIERHNQVFEHLRAISSSPVATRKLIAAALSEEMN